MLLDSVEVVASDVVVGVSGFKLGGVTGVFVPTRIFVFQRNMEERVARGLSGFVIEKGFARCGSPRRNRKLSWLTNALFPISIECFPTDRAAVNGTGRMTGIFERELDIIPGLTFQIDRSKMAMRDMDPRTDRSFVRLTREPKIF